MSLRKRLMELDGIIGINRAGGVLVVRVSKKPDYDEFIRAMREYGLAPSSAPDEYSGYRIPVQFVDTEAYEVFYED